MKTIKQVFVSVGYLLTSSVALAQTAPTTGAYVTDTTNSYVQDQALDAISSVNMIMCFMSSLRPEAKVGDGNYVALVDKTKCESKGGSGEDTNAGASNQVNYVNTIVNSTRASSSAPMLVSAWVEMKDDSPQQLIYTYTTVSEGASTAQPNGNFTMDFSGYPASGGNTQFMRGTLSANGSTITFYESGQRGGSYSNALTLTQSGTSSGSGRASNTEGGGTTDTTFAYNSTHFLRQKGTNTAQCFSRATSDANISTWRYGVYNANGSRLALTNPGFGITYETGGTTYYGYAGFYGVFFPDTALSAMGSSATVRGARDGTTYTYSKTGGKLTKLSKNQTTLNGVKGQPLRVWFSTGEAKLMWDGTNLVQTETMSCGPSGCTNTAINPPTAIAASTLLGLGFRVLNGWSDALGGPIAIPVPTSGNFLAATDVFYRTRTVVSAADMASLTLYCVGQCPKGKTDMEAALPNGEPYATVGSNVRNFGPTLISNAKTYVFSGGLMYLGSVSTANAVDASAFASTKLTGNNQNGIRSGQLVSSSDTSINCNSNGIANPSGTYLCPHLFNQVTDIYEWETGIKPWNQLATLSQGGTTVTIDRPKRLTITLTSSNSTLASTDTKIGSTLQLDYNGFGDLGGIPGSCYNPATNIKGPCGGTNTRYAPDFSLRAGAVVSDGSTNYFVKPIDQEIRFGKVSDSLCSSLTLPTTATLPTASSSTDPRTTIGTKPTLTSAPAVIHGVVQ